jgi:calmodulin
MNDFSEDKMKEYKEAFNIFDQNKDGYLDIEEMRLTLMTLGYELQRNELEEILSEYGTDKEDMSSSKIDFSSLVTYLNKRNREVDMEEELMECFKNIDKDGDGRISTKELKYVILTMGENFSDEEVEEMITQINPNGNGYFTYRDFLKMLLSK